MRLACGRGAGWSAVVLAVVFSAAWAAPAAGQRLTHGPILGRLGAEHVGVWARTSQPARFFVQYGTAPDKLDQRSAVAATRLAQDNTGWVLLDGLRPETRYFYRVVVEGAGAPAGAQPDGSFRTLPSSSACADPQLNPRGLYNFAFEFACGNHQRPDTTRIAAMETLLQRHADEVAFTIQNGDWIYEDRRDYTVDAWRRQVGVSADQTPRVVRIAPSIVAVWENYKAYLDRCASLRRLHRNLPAFFMYDDHEIIDDSAGAGQIGARPRRGVFRDIAVQAWLDYVGWSNPVAFQQPIRFGRARLKTAEDVLEDPEADFTKLDLRQAAELHVHWGGPHAALLGKQYDLAGGDPNAGVYQIRQVLGPHRLRIFPAARTDGEVSYSIGRRSYFTMRLANCEFVFLDTRGHRELPPRRNPGRSRLSILGAAQKAWVKRVMAESDADCFFVVSTVNFMIPHIADVNEPTIKEDSWTGYLAERDDMLRFFDSLGKKVFLLTGDLHNSFVVRITDRVWEFASGPRSSSNAMAPSEGGRPPNGVYDSYGTPCHIRWSTWFPNRETVRQFPQKVYCIVSVNNVLRNAAAQGGWEAFPEPHAVFAYYDGVSGRLLYAESVAF